MLDVDPVVVLGEGILRLLRHVGDDRGSLLVLEDLHWADQDTLAVLDYIAGAVAGSRVLVAVSSRSDESQPALLRRLPTRPGVVSLRLSPLAPSDVAELAAELAAELTAELTGRATLPAAVVDFLTAHAEGLPFLVEELLDGLVESGALVAGAAGWEVPGELVTGGSPDAG